MLVEARVPSLNLSQVTSQHYCTLVKGWSTGVRGREGSFSVGGGGMALAAELKEKYRVTNPPPRRAAPPPLRHPIHSLGSGASFSSSFGRSGDGVQRPRLNFVFPTDGSASACRPKHETERNSHPAF